MHILYFDRYAKLPYKNVTICSVTNILWYCSFYYIFANSGFYQNYLSWQMRNMLSWLSFHLFDLQGVKHILILLLINLLVFPLPILLLICLLISLKELSVWKREWSLVISIANIFPHLLFFNFVLNVFPTLKKLCRQIYQSFFLSFWVSFNAFNLNSIFAT